MTRAHPPASRGIVFAVAAFAAWPAFAEAADHRGAAGRVSGTVDAEGGARHDAAAAPARLQRAIALPEPTAARARVASARNAAARRCAGQGHCAEGPLAVAFPRNVPDGLASDRARALAVAGARATAAARRSSKSRRPARRRCASRSRSRRTSPASRCGSRATARTRNRSVRWRRTTLPPTRRASANSGRRCSTATSRRSSSTSRPASESPDAVLTLARVSHQVVAPASLTKLDAKAVDDIGSVRLLQHRRRVRDAAGRTAFVDSTKAVAATRVHAGRRLHVPLHRDAAQRFAVEQHAVLLLRQPLHRFGDRRAHAEHVLVLRCRRLRQQCDAGVRAADERRRAARAERRLGLGARAAQCRAAGGHALLGVARGADPERRDDLGHPPSGRRSQEVEPGNVAGLPASTPTARASRSVTYTQGTTEPGSSGAGAADVPASRRLLRSARRPVDGRRVVHDACRHRRVFAARQHAAADAPVPDARRAGPGRAKRRPSSSTIARSTTTSSRLSPREIADLDTGVHPGWERTGLRFMAYDDAGRRRESRVPVLPDAGIRRLALLFGERVGMRGRVGEPATVSRLDARERRMCSTSRCPTRRPARALPVPSGYGGSITS